MYDLTVIKRCGGAYIDSREVAEVVGRQHKHLLRDIRCYCEILENSTKPKIGLSDFFVESAYQDSTGRSLPHFLISKAGCELIATRFTGTKGIMFAVAYIAKFNELEAAEKKLTAPAAWRIQRFGAPYYSLIAKRRRNSGSRYGIFEKRI